MNYIIMVRTVASFMLLFLISCSRGEKSTASNNATSSAGGAKSEVAKKLIAHIEANSAKVTEKTLEPPDSHNGFWVSGNTGNLSTYKNGIRGILWDTWERAHDPVGGAIAVEKGWIFLRANGDAVITFNSYIYRLKRQSIAEAFAVKYPESLKLETRDWEGKWTIKADKLEVKVIGSNPDPTYFGKNGTIAEFDISNWKTAPRVIEITANDTMKFNLTTIEAKAGETIKIVLTNNGTLPKEAMGHNLVVLKPGSDGGAFCAAAMAAKATDYIPEALKSQVVVATALLGPKKSEEIILKDLKAGEYPYVCSFPAHFAVGMKGVLIVK